MSSYSGPDRRRFTRLEFDSSATLSHGDKKYQCSLVDISLKGVLIQLPEDVLLKQDKLYNLEVELGERVVVIAMQVMVVHAKGTLVGCRWESIDVESFAHLRRLLEINLGDYELLDREVEALISAQSDG